MQATLRAIRVHLGIIIDEAARRIGIPKNRLIAIERHRTVPSWPLVDRKHMIYLLLIIYWYLTEKKKSKCIISFHTIQLLDVVVKK